MAMKRSNGCGAPRSNFTSSSAMKKDLQTSEEREIAEARKRATLRRFLTTLLFYSLVSSPLMVHANPLSKRGSGRSGRGTRGGSSRRPSRGESRGASIRAVDGKGSTPTSSFPPSSGGASPPAGSPLVLDGDSRELGEEVCEARVAEASEAANDAKAEAEARAATAEAEAAKGRMDALELRRCLAHLAMSQGGNITGGKRTSAVSEPGLAMEEDHKAAAAAAAAAGTSAMKAIGRRLTTPITNANIRTAVSAWCSDPTTAAATYGNISGWDTSSVTNRFKCLFSSYTGGKCPSTAACSGPTYIPATFDEDLSKWNTSSATTMYEMFAYAQSFNSDVSSWDVSRVQDMAYMFRSASSFTSDVSAWDVSSVRDMESMFALASSFESDVSSWDVSRVGTMESMFRSASSFTSDVSSWNTSSVEDMSLMFFGASLFTSNVSAWDTSSVEDMESMFQQASLFTSDVSAWDVSSVQDMEALFYDASSFNSDVSAWDVSSVVNMKDMFHRAVVFNQPLGGWDVTSVVDMRGMFHDAYAFDWDLCWNLNILADTTAMFSASSSGSYSYSYFSDDCRVRTGCVKCGAGEYRVDNATCGRCPAGHYAEEPTDGSTGAVKCTACPAASPMTLVGATSDDECVAACDAGLLLSITEDGLSTPCVASCPHWAPADDNGITCSGCSAGSFLSGSGCVPCSAGYYQPLRGQTNCDGECSAGEYSGEGASSCSECDDEQYSLPASTDCFYVRSLSSSYDMPS
jgi:surface protein